jgi:hypothetical protein
MEKEEEGKGGEIRKEEEGMRRRERRGDQQY